MMMTTSIIMIFTSNGMLLTNLPLPGSMSEKLIKRSDSNPWIFRFQFHPCSHIHAAVHALNHDVDHDVYRSLVVCIIMHLFLIHYPRSSPPSSQMAVASLVINSLYPLLVSSKPFFQVSLSSCHACLKDCSFSIENFHILFSFSHFATYSVIVLDGLL